MAQTTVTTTTREELISAVQEELGLPSKAAAKKALDGVLNVIATTLSVNGKNPGYTLRIKELINFKVVKVAARDARNPLTGKKIPQAARTKVKATLVKEIKDLGK